MERKIEEYFDNDKKPDKAYIIAELSTNHCGSFELAKQTIKAMGKAGADAVKVQTYTPDTMTLNSDKPWFKSREDSPWAGKRLYEIYEEGQTPWEWHKPLKKIANKLGMDFFSSPFDISAVESLEKLGVPAYKIASLEITHIPLIEAVAKTGKPIIFSTGAADEDDIKLAIDTCLKYGNNQIAFLKCTSAYPTPMEEVNLKGMVALRKKFNTLVGISDHTLGHTVPVASIALGAQIIEKHFILNKDVPGLDKEFSLTYEDFKEMVKQIRNTELALGKENFDITPRMANARKFTRSLYAVKDIKKGSIMSEDMLGVFRPGKGMHPKDLRKTIGSKSNTDIERGDPILKENLV